MRVRLEGILRWTRIARKVEARGKAPDGSEKLTRGEQEMRVKIRPICRWVKWKVVEAMLSSYIQHLTSFSK